MQDDESSQLLTMIKKSVGLDECQERLPNTKGAIGDGRNRSTPHNNSFSVGYPQNNAAPRSLWNNSETLNSNSAFIPPYSSFESRSSLFDSPIRDLNEEKLLPPESHFQQFFNNDTASTNSFNPSPRAPLLDNAVPHPGPITTSINPPISIPTPNFATSLFADPYTLKQPGVSGSVDSALPLPVGFRRPQSASFSLGGNSLWNGSPLLRLANMGSESSVDNAVDEELARAIEDELNVTPPIVSAESITGLILKIFRLV